MPQTNLPGKLGELSNALKKNFSNLNMTDEEIRSALKSPHELTNVISAKTGMAKEEVDKRVHKAMSAVGLDESTARGFMEKWGDKVGDKIAEIKNKLSH